MKITEKSRFNLEIDEKELQVIKNALSDHASQWLLFATKSENRDIQEGSMSNYKMVCEVRDQFKEHFEKLIDNK